MRTSRPGWRPGRWCTAWPRCGSTATCRRGWATTPRTSPAASPATSAWAAADALAHELGHQSHPGPPGVAIFGAEVGSEDIVDGLDERGADPDHLRRRRGAARSRPEPLGPRLERREVVGGPGERLQLPDDGLPGASRVGEQAQRSRRVHSQADREGAGQLVGVTGEAGDVGADSDDLLWAHPAILRLARPRWRAW